MEEENSIPIIVKRKIVKLGDSLCISLPPDWLRQNDLDKGDEVFLLSNHDVRVLSPNSKVKVYQQISKLVDMEPL